MTTEQTFEDFGRNPYEAEARHLWGDDAVADANTRVRGWSPQDAERARTGYPAVHQGLAALAAAGIAVDDARVQDLIDEHYRVTSVFWTPSRETYLGLAQTFQHDERFNSNIGGRHPALVTYLCEAMTVYAHTRLS